MAVLTDPALLVFMDQTFRPLSEAFRDVPVAEIYDEYVNVVLPILNAANPGDTVENRVSEGGVPITVTEIKAFASLVDAFKTDRETGTIPAVIAKMTIQPPQV